MTLRATVYLDPAVDSAIIAELECMSFRRRAGRLVQLLRVGAETSLRQRDGTLRGGLVRCRHAPMSSRSRMRVGIRLSGPADAAVLQLLGEAVNRRSERLRQLAQCGLEREAFWLRNAAIESAQAARVPDIARSTLAEVSTLRASADGSPLATAQGARRPGTGARSATPPATEPAANPWVMMAGFGTVPRRSPSGTRG